MPSWSIEILLDSERPCPKAFARWEPEYNYAEWTLMSGYRVYQDAQAIGKKIWTIQTNEYPLNQGILSFIASRDKEVPNKPLCFWKILIHWVSTQVVDDIRILVIKTLELDENEIIIK